MDNERLCEGFGDLLGKCTSVAIHPKVMTKKFWCEFCEQARRTYITKQFDKIGKLYK